VNEDVRVVPLFQEEIRYNRRYHNVGDAVKRLDHILIRNEAVGFQNGPQSIGLGVLSEHDYSAAVLHAKLVAVQGAEIEKD
jgi:hypothetical protein